MSDYSDSEDDLHGQPVFAADESALLASDDEYMSDVEALEQEHLQARDRQQQLEKAQAARNQKQRGGPADPEMVLSRSKNSIAQIMQDPELARLERLTGIGQLSFLPKNPFVKKDGLVRLSHASAFSGSRNNPLRAAPPSQKKKRKQKPRRNSADSDEDSDAAMGEDNEDSSDEAGDTAERKEGHDDSEESDEGEQQDGADPGGRQRTPRRLQAMKVLTTAQSLDNAVAQLANPALGVQLPKLQNTQVVIRRKSKEDKPTAGKGWYDLPATQLTREVKNDLKLIALQSYLDPKSYTKREDRKQFPKYFQMGTVVESAKDFYGRMTRKERSGGSLTGQILSDPKVKKFVRKRFKVIQSDAQKNSSRPKNARISNNRMRLKATKGRK